MALCVHTGHNLPGRKSPYTISLSFILFYADAHRGRSRRVKEKERNRTDNTEC